MHSILLSLSLNILLVAQALISHIHDCIKRSNLGILLGGADVSNCESSAYEWCEVE